MNKERINKFKIDVKAFLWYLVTEPFRTVRNMFKMGITKINIINKPSSWVYIYLTLMIAIFLTDNHKMKWVFLSLLLLAILRYEWSRGRFRALWRKKEITRLEKKYGNHEKTEEEIVAEFKNGEEANDKQKI